MTRISSGSAMLLTSCYEENKGRGAITMKFLSEKTEGGSIGSSARTGFTEPFSNQQKILLKKTKPISKLSPDPSYDKRKMTKSSDSLVAHNKRIKSVKETGSGKGSKHGEETASIKADALVAHNKRIKAVKETGYGKGSKNGEETASIKENKPGRELIPVSIMPSKKSPPSAKRDDHKRAVSSIDSPTAQNPPVSAMSTPIAKSNRNVIPSSEGRKEMNNMDLMITPEPKKMKKVSSTHASISNAASAIPKEPSHRQMENVSQAQSRSPISRKQVQGNNDTTSSPSMKTPCDILTEPLGIAVSPEQLKKAESPPAPLATIDTSKSITKFFSKSKEAKKIVQSALKPVAKISKTKPKKVQFKKVDRTTIESEGRASVSTKLPTVPRKRKILQEVNSTRKVPVPRKKRVLQEGKFKVKCNTTQVQKRVTNHYMSSGICS